MRANNEESPMNCQSVVHTRGDALNVIEVRDLYGTVTVDKGPVAELPVVIVAPRPDGAVLPQGQTKMRRGGVHYVCEPNYSHWFGATSFPAAVAELPVGVVAPRPDGAVLQGQAMRIACYHAGYVGEAFKLYGRQYGRGSGQF